MPLKKSELYSSLWQSCDELRGGMDASQYKDYVLVLLFVKYVSDKYAGQDDGLITIPRGGGFKDMVALKGDKEIGDKVNKIIAKLAAANELKGVIDVADFNDNEKLGSGKEMVDRLSRLVGIFENLNFSRNRASGDDLLGDAYEYLMRHFATESGKSKGQFYTPAEVSRIMAMVIGINQARSARESVYDPTCGSGSLLLKAHDQASVNVSIYGQEMDVATRALAKMNMILHGCESADIAPGGSSTLANPFFKDGTRLKTFDYAVANPPFSSKAWTTGFDAEHDQFSRFPYGVPPAKNGDYAFLLHVLASLKSSGTGAVIMPHGVLFRGNAEANIRRELVGRGFIKAIIGLPPNLFYGTGISACIVVLDKKEAATRRGIFMIDASRGFLKDGNKNRLREQDIHKMVDVFNRQVEVPRFSRIVPLEEISDEKNGFNLNLPRYIDSTDPEDVQDIDGHLRGGIPARDLDALAPYWTVLPSVRTTLFESAGRPGYARLKTAPSEVKSSIVGHAEFSAFQQAVTLLFAHWCKAVTPQLMGFAKDGHPKALIASIAEELLADFRKAPLLDAYDIYQHLMDHWVEAMQDDAYMIAADGWVKAAKPREIVQAKDKNGRLTWPEAHDYTKGRRRFKSDLVPAPVLVARYFTSQREAIEALDNQLAVVERQLDVMRGEHGGEEGLLADVIEGEGEKQKITAKAVKGRMKEIGNDAVFEDERDALRTYAELLEQQSDTKAKRKAAQDDLDQRIDAKYPTLTDADVKTLVVRDKWMARLTAAVHGEVDRVSQTLAGRIRQLAERYDTPLPELTDKVVALATRVNAHLKKMGASWN
jgi:type I restriction enzyme M protein